MTGNPGVIRQGKGGRLEPGNYTDKRILIHPKARDHCWGSLE